MAGSPFQLVQPENPFTPSPYGLSSVVNWQTTADERWTGGVKWEPVCITGAATTISPCVTGAPLIDVPAKVPTWTWGLRGARPFTLYAEIDCSPVGWETELMQRAAQGFIQGEQWQMERTFQTGVAGGFANVIYPNLTVTGPVLDPIDPTILLQPASTVISGAAIDVVEGLGRLEQAIMGGCYAGGRCVIHMPYQIADELAAEGLLYVRPGETQLKTALGNLVAVGAGYLPSAGPGGTTAPAGSGWMFATGTLFGYRGQIKILGGTKESLDRAENTLRRIAERTVLLGWDCCLAAVLVTLGGKLAGTFNSAGPAT